MLTSWQTVAKIAEAPKARMTNIQFSAKFHDKRAAGAYASKLTMHYKKLYLAEMIIISILHNAD